MLKKKTSLLCLLLALALLAGCGGAAGSSSGSVAVNYKQLLLSARSSEVNNVLPIAVDEKTASLEGNAVSETSEEAQRVQAQYDLVFNEGTGFTPEPMQRYAISLGFSITQAYGVAIILPAEGKQQEVIDMVNNYVLLQQKAQENYLPDQYQIALDAQVKTVKTGEVLLVMCEGADEVMATLEAGLK